ncbi:glycosyltransferase family 4 protein [Flavobacterium hibernum]|uniref:Glycosyl transferase n=1 Tax=Flavobacterium hibernum TaxID=37752 RepID=A0A0D0EFJ5_9FLAO|nr:glycosyltransferase family 4 protein [Flavobacterium hibernum]KIO54214.1 group 1 glycosyl transferase [Flavobacterium hibernum]OXA89677.1 glycosyl transferase [Flavobacterium hibernum]STO09972.1 colanic acid biosynthesis glycosyltransferase WcaL [Flavobacterium hibernum]
MRIIQMIDSLEAGGAERMAVNYANALVNEIEFSGLVTTRKEGSLRDKIDANVSYLFLNKKRQLDFGALFRLRSFVLKNKVTHIHAHSTSFFLAFLLKLIHPSLRIIRHDHYGNNEFLLARPYFVLKQTAPFFNGIIVVNQKLKNWSELKLKAKNIIYLPNFSVKEKSKRADKILKGCEGKRIVCLANLRPQKNHFLLLEVAKKLKKTYSDWTFHLVGKDFEDDYAMQIKKLILEYELEENVFLYGSRPDVENILNLTSIAILTSQSEGLPVSLLEYGMYKKPIVVTRVGEIPTIVQHEENGFVVDSNEPDLFYKYLVKLITTEKIRFDFGQALYNTVQSDYTDKSVISKYLNWLQKS